MKISVNIRKNGLKQIKSSFMITFTLCIMGLGLIFFSQSNFDEDKVNKFIFHPDEIVKGLKSSVSEAFRSEKTEKSLRPQRRPFSRNFNYAKRK